MPTPQPQLAQIEGMQDSFEARLNAIEWSNQELYARLFRSEEAYATLNSKYQAVMDGLSRCHQWSNEFANHILTMIPDPESAVHRDVFALRQNISRHVEQLRSMEEPQDSIFSNKQSFYPNNTTLEPAVPLSPRQRPFDESRRPSLQGLAPRASGMRAPVPSYLQISPRRFGSIGSGSAGSGAYSPSSRSGFAPPPPPPPPPQHPLANMTSPPSNLPRRHTSADIRVQGWGENGQPPSQPSYAHGTSPYASGQSSSAWPSSPRTQTHPGDQQIRDALAQYELPRVVANSGGSRQQSPGPGQQPHDNGAPTYATSFNSSYANSNDAGWQIPGGRHFKGLETPGPPTRRSSMASNVHSLLNPADTAEREGEDEGGPAEERKRKRVL